MLHHPFIGATYLLRGARLLLKPALWPYVAIPLAINITLFALLIGLLAGQFGALIDGMLPTLPDWLAWLSWLLWLLFAVTAGIAVFFTFSIVANLVAAPFNGLLAEAVERSLSGEDPATGGGLAQALRETPAALRDELVKLGYFARWGLPLLLLFWIPGVNLAAPGLWLGFSAWMLALEYLDYPLGNRGLRFAEQRRHLAGRRLLVLGFGGAVLLVTLIPLLNLIVIPAAVAGASCLGHERLRQPPQSPSS